MLQARVQDDGSLVYPNRGPPPPDQAGYTRDSGNPYIFRPIFPECKFRDSGVLKTPCCVTYFMSCVKGHAVSLTNCLKCIESGRRDA